MNNRIIVSPSILFADFVNLERDIKRVEDAGADWIHVDVMDGHFVPNITIGIPVVKAIKRIARVPLDVHSMIENPDKHVVGFAKVAKKNGKQAVVYVIFCFIKRILRIKVILPSLNINIMILFYYLCIVFSNLADSHVSECLSGFL